jgi:biopolymer transport protein ExbD
VTVSRKNRRASDAPVDTELPITPMLDMTFQLMAFFIMTFKPQDTEGQLPILLPKDDASKNSVASPEIPPDEVDDYKLGVYSTSGRVDSLTLKVGASQEAFSGPTMFETLRQKLSAFKKPTDRPAKITIESTDQLRYAELIRMMDECKKAGFESVGIAQMAKPKVGGGAEPEKK